MAGLEYINLSKPRMFLRWYLDEYNFLKVELIQVKD
jgi:hypothetical protein